MIALIKKPFLAISMALAVFVAVNLLSNTLKGMRVDLTEEKLYTLSEGSEKVLSDLRDRPIQATLYFSSLLAKEVPTYGTFAGRVRDMLREFEAASGGGLIFKEVDPKPYSAAEDRAVESGMQGLPLEAGGDKVYFGLSIAYADEVEQIANSAEGEGPVVAAIPFFQAERETFLEYDMMKAIYTLGQDDQPVIGVITATTMFGDPYAQAQGRPSVPWAALQQASDFFSVKRLFKPEDFLAHQPDILMVAHPASLEDSMQYAIDQYMLRGGKAVFLLDPWYESKGQGYAPDRSDGTLDKLLPKWGVELADRQVVGDREIARQVNGGTEGQIFAAPYIVWLQPTAANMNQDDPTIADIQNLLLPSAGAISLTESSPLKLEPLITTTADAKLVPIADLREQNVMKLLEGYEPNADAPFVVAARFSGNVETAFPDGPPPFTEEELKEIEEKRLEAEEKGEAMPQRKPRFLDHVHKSEAPMNVLMVADADFLADRFWVRVQDFFGQQMMVPFADNGSLLLGMFETLNGSGELMQLRSRGISARPFEVIADLQKEAEAEFRAQEQALSARLVEIETQLASIQSSGANDANLVGADTSAREKAEAEFTDELLEIRQQLRAVNLSLRQDIASLENSLKFVNIALVPLIVISVALVLGFMRRRRYR